MGVWLGTHLGQLWETQILGHGLGHVWDVLPQELWDLDFMGTFLGSTGMPLGRVWDITLSTRDTCADGAGATQREPHVPQ